MSDVPDPGEIFDRAVEEGERRLDQSLLELVSTSFIAGFTVVFGIIALGIVEGIVHPVSSELAKLAGALAFGPGLVFLVVGRTELFNENFFDPIAASFDDDSWRVGAIARLWAVTFVLNLLGGFVLVGVLSVDGALPSGSAEALVRFAEEAVRRPDVVEFVRAFVGGALVALLSFLLATTSETSSRIALSYVVGVFLALGPFDHVVVTVLHVAIGFVLGANVAPGSLAETTAVVTAGNLVGGVGLVTLTHVGQGIGARESED
ncbi:formate/nitrite transporter family protein [Halorubellus sp. JP-L1]|uniref:formate/nitrite transporter family protein n=1 Tax=Halorubellus sp. JP-L1 TaxID=2715753 RepID=UPI00140DCD89|nr:formate/nitrite transporter family protein [Halorubellus sp. JP-L1]